MQKYILVLLVFGLFSACQKGSQSRDQQEQSDTETTAEAVTSIKGQEVVYETDSLALHGYIAYDDALEGPRPAVLVVHEWWGHNEYVRERADMLAKLGYVAFAVDMYGEGKQVDHPDDAGKFAMSVMGDFPKARQRFEAALEAVRGFPQVDGHKVAAIGYCFGGGVVLAMANAGVDLDAVASFHGSVALPVMPGEPGSVNARVLVLNGADDPFVTEEQIVAYKAAMDEAEANYEFINYPGAKHSFTSKGADANGEKFDLPLAYNAEADAKSWAAMQEMFKEVFEE